MGAAFSVMVADGSFIPVVGRQDAADYGRRDACRYERGHQFKGGDLRFQDFG